MTDLNAFRPYGERLIGLRGEAYDKEMEKILHELCPDCTDEEKAKMELPMAQPPKEQDAQSLQGIQPAEALSIALKHIDNNIEQGYTHEDVVLLFDAFLTVAKSGYTGVGGVDQVVNGFGSNVIFRDRRDLMHPRFLGTYNSVVGVREFHRKQGVYSPDNWEQLQSSFAVKIAEDIMFGLSFGLIPAEFYIDFMEAGAG